MLVILPFMAAISILAFWHKHPVLFQATAGVSIITAFYIPDSVGGVFGGLTVAVTYMVMLYAFLCVYLSTWYLLFPRGSETS